MNAGTATRIISNAKTVLPPKRSASIPVTMRSKAPRKTGTATRNAVCVAVRWNVSRKRGANALISPQAAKQIAKETVPRVNCRFGREVAGVLFIVSPQSLPAGRKKWVQTCARWKRLSAYISSTPPAKLKVNSELFVSLRNLNWHAHDHGFFMSVAGFKNECAENIDRENRQSRKLAERRSGQNGPRPLRITLIGDDLARNTKCAAYSDDRKPRKHELRAPKHPHSRERRQDALPDAQDHYRNEPDC